MPRTAAILISLLALLLAACQKPAPASADIRPVRTLTIKAAPTESVAEFAGEIRPRVETRAGFQVGGRIVQRKVELGQQVRSGEPLATIDPQDYRLAAQASEAGLTAARVERDQQRADFKRSQELKAKGFISEADLDRRRATLDAAEARHLQASASAQTSGNQAGYSVLKAPHDAVVVGIDAEVGQVVQPGQSVIRLARTGEKEVAISIPEQYVAAMQGAKDISVQLWAGGPRMKGRLREVSPEANSATRTFPARVALIDPPATVALGMTASVSFATPASSPVIALPLQALMSEGGVTHAWVVDPVSETVRRIPLDVVNVAGNEVVVNGGLNTGDIVVTAGVHQLKEGQKVRLLGVQPAEPVLPTAVKASTEKN